MTRPAGPPAGPPQWRGQRGAASVLVLAMMGVLLLVGTALGVVSALVVDHRKAQSAADLAALAAARTLADGGDACGAAASVALRNGARLDDCGIEGVDVQVRVTVSGPHWLGQRGDLPARARAGPGDPAAG